MYLKNLAMLKIADAGDEQFRSVRMAPLYDPVTTGVFPRLRRDRMALTLAGKDDRLRRADFRALAATVGARASDADAAIDEMIGRLKEATLKISRPELPGAGPQASRMADDIMKIVRERIDSFA